MSDTSESHEVGDRIVTTVYSRGDRSAEVVGTVTSISMSKRYPDRVACYTVDATEAGYGLLSVEAAKARRQAPARKTHETGISAAEAIAAEVGVTWADMRRIASQHMSETMPDLDEIGSSDVSIHLSSLGNHDTEWLRTEAERVRWANDKITEMAAASGQTEDEVVAGLRRMFAPRTD